MDSKRLQIEIMDALAQATRQHTVALWHETSGGNQGLGTGSLVLSGNDLFILTCHHVAIDLFASSTVEALAIRPDKLGRIRREKLCHRFSDQDDDIALIQVLDRTEIPDLGNVLNVNHFDFIDQFSDLPHDGRGFVISGYPARAVTVRPGRSVDLRHVSYLTIQSNEKASDGQWLFLDYREGERQAIHEPGDSLTTVNELIPANGFSGSPILMLPHPGHCSGIWHTGLIKIVAIQCATDHKKWVQCATLRKLRSWLRE